MMRIGAAMARGLAVRLMAAALLVAAELAAASAVLVVAPVSAEAQFLFGDRFPFFGFGRNNNRRGGGWFGLPQQQDNSQYVDYSRAPAPTPRKPDAPPVQTPILVLGDAMADWLGYGMEQAFADTPEIGILRRHRTLSGLIRADVRSDPRGDYPDWPQVARETIASQKPKFVVMMIGLNDRRSIRELVQAARAKPAQPATPDSDPASRELDQPAAKPAPEAAAAPDAAPPATTTKTYDFRSDAWSEAYIKRIDDTIAALKTSGVPIFWVGLPPVRSGRNAGDIPFLNELYRSRADKAGIVYVDVWDGFVDEDGRFAQTGPDFEGQTRRLRSGDGVYFTQPGARKLAHFVEREIDRWLTARPVALAVPAEEPKAAVPAPADAAAPAAAPGKVSNSKARPLAGPALPLISEPAEDSGELLGGGSKARPSAVADAVAAKVLVKGEAMAVPAGRADDFSWPRRNVAPPGADPIVATTELPMTPMVADRTAAPAKPADAATDPAAAQAAAAKQQAQQQAAQRVRSAGYQTQYRPSFFGGGGRGGGMNFFPFLFGGGR
jgi:uncharacterized protein